MSASSQSTGVGLGKRNPVAVTQMRLEKPQLVAKGGPPQSPEQVLEALRQERWEEISVVQSGNTWMICSLPIVSRSLERRLQDQCSIFSNFSPCFRLYVDDVTGGNSISVSRLVHQTEHFVASVPFAQVPRGRIIVAPKRHCPRFEDRQRSRSHEDELKDLGRLLRLLLASLYRSKEQNTKPTFSQVMVKAQLFPRVFNDFFSLPQAKKPDPDSETSPTSVGTGLLFGGSNPLPEDVAEALSRQGAAQATCRFQEVTLEVLLQKGATHFAWVRPKDRFVKALEE
eukprot:Skav210971  [mRNA]  locus=scaffold2129:145203:157596:+ [translate_table: standard]